MWYFWNKFWLPYCSPFYLGVSTREWAYWLPFRGYHYQERQNDFTGFPCDETTLIQFTVLHIEVFLLSSLALGYKKTCYVYQTFQLQYRERVNRAGWITTLPKRVERTTWLPQFVLSWERWHLLHAKWQSHYYESQQSLILFSSRNVQEHIINGILLRAFWKYTSAIAALTNPSFEGLTSTLTNGHHRDQHNVLYMWVVLPGFTCFSRFTKAEDLVLFKIFQFLLSNFHRLRNLSMVLLLDALEVLI